jgi:hypothetical protein
MLRNFITIALLGTAFVIYYPAMLVVTWYERRKAAARLVDPFPEPAPGEEFGSPEAPAWAAETARSRQLREAYGRRRAKSPLPSWTAISAKEFQEARNGSR